MSPLPNLDAQVPPVVWTAGGLLAQLSFSRRRTPRCVRALALALLVASAALGIWAVRGFQRHATTIDPHQLDHVRELVTDGANSISRNPMYTALVGGLVGVVLWCGCVAALVPAAAVWAALNTFQVPPEEAALAKTFAGDFDDYRRRVPRWL